MTTADNKSRHYSESDLELLTPDERAGLLEEEADEAERIAEGTDGDEDAEPAAAPAPVTDPAAVAAAAAAAIAPNPAEPPALVAPAPAPAFGACGRK